MVTRPPTGTIPETPGSYQFKDKDGRVIYVGKASSLRQRLSNYFQDPRNMHPRTAQMVATAVSVEWNTASSSNTTRVSTFVYATTRAIRSSQSRWMSNSRARW